MNIKTMSLDENNDGFVETVGSKIFKTRRTKRTKKLSDPTLKLIKKRREMILPSSVDALTYRQFNTQISKFVKCDWHRFNTERIKQTVEKNRGSRSLQEI